MRILALTIALLALPASTRAEQPPPGGALDADQLEAKLGQATNLIQVCREAADCADTPARRQLAEAYLVRVTHRAVFWSTADQAGAANLRFLDPALAEASRGALPDDDGTEPEAWLVRRFAEPETGETAPAEAPEPLAWLENPWEAATLRISVEMVAPECSEFVAGGYEGRDCHGAVAAGLSSLLRPTDGLVLRPHLLVGAWYHTDLEAVHQLAAPGVRQPWAAWFLDLGVTAGAERGIHRGVFRLDAGPVFRGERLVDSMKDRMAELEIAPAIVGSLWLGLDLGFEAEWWVADALRIGPSLRILAGSEVALFWYQPDTMDDLLEKTTRASNSDLELSLRPALVLSTPARTPTALHLEVGPVVDLEILGQDALAQLPPDRTAVSADVGLFVRLGAEIRIP